MNMENLIAVSNKLVEVNNKLTEVIKQRDTLAEALQALIDCIQETRGKDAHDAITNAHEILQSLNIKL